VLFHVTWEFLVFPNTGPTPGFAPNRGLVLMPDCTTSDKDAHADRPTAVQPAHHDHTA
jgi:hypothetical protein